MQWHYVVLQMCTARALRKLLVSLCEDGHKTLTRPAWLSEKFCHRMTSPVPSPATATATAPAAAPVSPRAELQPEHWTSEDRRFMKMALEQVR